MRYAAHQISRSEVVQTNLEKSDHVITQALFGAKENPEDYEHEHSTLKAVTDVETTKEVEDVLEYTEMLVQDRNDLIRLLAAAKSAEEAVPSSATPAASGAGLEPLRTIVVQSPPPKLLPEVFSGKQSDWRRWWQIYVTRVHENNVYASKAEKFAALLDVIGGAKEEIDDLDPTNDNYDTAIEYLKRRYDNVPDLITAHIHVLNNKREISEAEAKDPKKLRSYILSILKELSSLENLGEQVNGQRCYTALVLAKFPYSVVSKLTSKRRNTEWKMDELRKLLRDYTSVSEEALRYSSQNPAMIRPHVIPDLQPTVGAATLAAPRPPAPGPVPVPAGRPSSRRPQSSKRTLPKPCFYCQGEHWTDECRRHATIEDRKAVLRRQAKCHICFQDHMTSACTNKGWSCFHCKTRGHHHRSLCPSKFPESSRLKTGRMSAVNAEAADTDVVETTAARAAPTTVGATKPTPSTLVATESNETAVILQTARVPLTNPANQQLKAVGQCILDTASHQTYITDAVAEQMQLPLEDEHCAKAGVFGDSTPRNVKARKTELQVRYKDGSSELIKAHVVPEITCDIVRAAIPRRIAEYVQENYAILADKLPTVEETTKIDMLLGLDYYYDVTTPERVPLESGLWLQGSKLGWIVTGKYDNTKRQPNMALSVICPSEARLFTGSNDPVSTVAMLDIPVQEEPKTPAQDVDSFWKVESLGIAPVELLEEDEEALRQVDEGLYHNGERYVVPFPKRPCLYELPDNYRLARGRLEALRVKLEGDDDLFQKYNEIMKDQLQKGVVEIVYNTSESGPVQHFVPHHAHTTPQKTTTKVRIVYNASAKTKGARSLNESLLRGPVMLRNLVGMLVRFRYHRVAIVCDVEKAFLQVAIADDDKDLTRFLWFENFEFPKPGEPTRTVTLRFCRVPFGVICSPFLLERTVDYHLRRWGSQVASDINDNIYVDNVSVGRDNVKDAVQFYEESKRIFSAEAAMNLREYTSNSKEFLDRLPEVDTCRDRTVKVLGLVWDTETDRLSLSVPDCMEQPVTKRVALSTLHRIFDPCGLALPVTIVWRVLLQKTWKEAGAEWDIALSPALQEEWMQLAKGLKELAKLTIPRYVGMNLKECTNELIGFCDASAKAYAANIYLRSVRPDGTIVTTLLFAKGRVAPQDKVISIPRLELLANLIMIRCLGFIAEQVHLPIVRHTVFTDSQCVLHWLRSTKRLSVFVSNRIREIRECEEKYQLEYNYVNTKENPADIPSKGIDAADLIGNRLWEEGPTYLREDRSRWPIQPLPPIDSNMKADIAAEECMYSATLLVVEENDNCLYGIDVSKFSSFGKLVNTFGYVRKFVNNCKSRLQKRREGQQPVEVDKLLTVDERREARMLLVREVQRTGLPEVLEALTTSKKCSVVQQLRLYLDEQQLIRCRGRIDRSEDLHHDAKRPILLPRKHIFTRLLVQHVHEELMHAGPSHTLAALRYQFWIPQGKTMIKQVLH